LIVDGSSIDPTIVVNCSVVMVRHESN
jgi:hypothetical protein